LAGGHAAHAEPLRELLFRGDPIPDAQAPGPDLLEEVFPDALVPVKGRLGLIRFRSGSPTHPLDRVEADSHVESCAAQSVEEAGLLAHGQEFLSEGVVLVRVQKDVRHDRICVLSSSETDPVPGYGVLCGQLRVGS
jgi:hypothetical protein